jgi:hypothetical protein
MTSEAAPEAELEVERLLGEVSDLAAALPLGDSEAFLARIAAARARFTSLFQGVPAAALTRRWVAYAEQRFKLVDEPEEYGLATDELITLSLVLADAPLQVAPALQRGVVLLTNVLSEPGVPQQFARLLRQLRALARQSGDDQLRYWVDGLVRALPD